MSPPSRLTFAIAVCVVFGAFGWGIFSKPNHSPGRPSDLFAATPATVVITYKPGLPTAPVTVTFRNISDESVRVTGVRSSCGCTIPHFDHDELASPIRPGESFSLSAEGHPPTLGQKRVHLTVLTSSKVQPEFRVPVLLQGRPLPVPRLTSVPEILEVEAARLEPLSHEFTIHTREVAGSRPWLTSCRTEKNYEAVMLKLDEESDATTLIRSYRFRLSGPAPPSNGTPIRTRLRLLAESEEFEEIPVTYRNIPAVRAVPEVLVFRKGATAARAVYFQRSNGESAGPVVPEPPAVSWIEIETIEPYPAGSPLVGRAMIRVVEEVPSGSDTTLSFKTGNASCPQVSVVARVVGDRPWLQDIGPRPKHP